MSYCRPRSLAEALETLASAPRTILAGGTDLYPATTRASLTGQVLDITAIESLRGYREEQDYWRLGAAMTWSQVIAADLPPAFDGLKLAAREVGARQIQNQGTLAGNLCNASPAADGVPPLLTLDAELEIARQGETRRLPLSSFVTGLRQTALRADELVTAILVPQASAKGQASFLKLGARKYLVISIAMVAARTELQAGQLTNVVLAVGSCSAVARRLSLVEERLRGRSPAEALLSIDDETVASALAPIDDVRGTASYRSHAAAELLRRCLAQAMDPVSGARAA